MTAVDYFRVRNGVSVDGVVEYLHGVGVPGVSPATSAAPTGSTYADTASGILYSKIGTGAGTDKWNSSVATGSLLWSESVSGASPPSAQANNSVAIGSGAQTFPGAIGSLAIGDQSLARLPGGIVSASGRFQTSGDAQCGQYMVRTTTVNHLPTECFIDGTGGSLRVELPDDSTWSFSVRITAHRTDGDDGHAGFYAAGVIYRKVGPGATHIQGVVSKSVLSRSNANWDINISSDPTYGALRVVVTGESGKIIRWLAVIDTVEVTN